MMGVTLVAFIAMTLAPGDVAHILGGDTATQEIIADIRERLGLDKPAYQRYFIFLAHVAKGDLGRSHLTRQPVLSEITLRMPTTVTLAVTSMVVGTTLGLIFGIVAAVKLHSVWDNLVMLIATMGLTMPAFWLGLMLMLVFSVYLGWLPAAGRETSTWLILPAATLQGHTMAVVARMTRGSLLEVLQQDYMRTARAKGLSPAVVLRRHALKNALIPVVTVLGIQVGLMLAGAVVVESVFALPGLGRLLVSSMLLRDTPVVLGLVLAFAVVIVVANLIVDLLYGYLNPRIRYE